MPFFKAKINFSLDDEQEKILKISPQNIYIKFENITAFGVSGNYFESV